MSTKKSPTICGHSDRQNVSFGLCRPCDKRKRIYGISPEEWDGIEKKYGGKCYICGGNSKKMHLDHCHKTGRVRGLLCYTCNSGLGNFRDSTELLEKARGYLLEYA